MLGTMAHHIAVVRRLCTDGIPLGVEDVRIAQRALIAAGYDPGPVDGVAGPLTMRSYSDALADFRDPRHMRIIRCDAPGGVDLRAQRDGGPWPDRTYLIPKNERRVQVTTWHWTAGAVTALELAQSLRRSRLSSHYAIDASGIYEMLPVSYWAQHAGWINEVAIGVDICQPVQAHRLGEALDAGYQCEVVDNPSIPRRGDRRCLSLDPRIAAKARWLAEHLSETHGIPMVTPADHAVQWSNMAQLGDWTGHAGHYHSAGNKWDPAPWMGSIFGRGAS